MFEPEIRDHYGTYASLSNEEWGALYSLAKLRTIKKDQHFITPGDLPATFGIIKKGLFRLFYLDSEGKEWVKAFRTNGELLGAYAEQLQGLPSRTFIQALTDSEIYEVPLQEFGNFTKDKLPWQQLLRRVAEMHFIQKENREHQLLYLSASQRYELFRQENPEIHAMVPDYHIASYLGITAQAFSRLKSKRS